MATITLFPPSTSVAFYPAIPTGLNVLGQASYSQTVKQWQANLYYKQKFTDTDEIVIMVHTQASLATAITPPQLYICDQYGYEITAINLNVAPYWKGCQFVSANTIINPYTQSLNYLLSSMWVFKFSDFAADLGDNEFYCLRLDNYNQDTATVGSQTFSEPILVRASYENTLKFEFNYATSNAQKNVLISGWYDDYPTNTIPYSPVFMQRWEGYVYPLSLKALNIGYLQQSYLQNQLRTLQQRTWELKIGENSTGLPDYGLVMATEAVLSDNLTIDGYPYILYNPSSSANLADLWKVRRAGDAATVQYATTPIAEKTDAQQALFNPVPDYFGRIFTEEFDDTFM